jgi:hypothetical protein
VHSKNVRGKLQMWVDILTAEESKRYPPVPIADMRPAPCEFEVQVVVWKSVDVKAMDAGNMNDLFARVFMEGHEYQVQQSTSSGINTALLLVMQYQVLKKHCSSGVVCHCYTRFG